MVFGIDRGKIEVDFFHIIIILRNWFNHLQLEIELAENTGIAAIVASAKEENELRIPYAPTPAQPADQARSSSGLEL